MEKSNVHFLIEDWHIVKTVIPADVEYKIMYLSKSAITLNLPQNIIDEIRNLFKN